MQERKGERRNRDGEKKISKDGERVSERKRENEHCSTLQHTATHCNTLQPSARE